MLTERRSFKLIGFEVTQLILGFASFTVALVSLCYKIFKDDNKK
ncbi:putative holin-like toxin [Streptococcus ruminantium]|uniref:Holin-like toxin n=1 Tax=Streptococcus ruminantium TaxID=1917441 RepID=A0ABU1B4K4_9STRE|nr:putative holin-like toxin [Streptococcus ruminantium]MDQ8759382.1 putative holin-like toxin [Streptococcus ruminantium]MDQ8764963.1 putative holin-like toxin [Streptococcus ruminantium]MDQ8767474.1 putative holin-like toxin [Streptococcus ruminantium]MDQ8770034.1 putative holin-like toxin [Streptococcus ruminantium]MDQ8774489.1 putative holin-like toxin [Streptococcus ruminantium]